MPVPLREHLEATAEAEVKRVNLLFTICLGCAVFAWIELGRRLGILNHAHETAVEVQHTYVSEDIYRQGKAAQDEKIENVEKEQGNVRAGRAATLAVITAVGIIVTLVVLLANGKLG
jgi:hypothetical protein